jgi:DNA-binding cell septation regulator SpoVG
MCHHGGLRKRFQVNNDPRGDVRSDVVCRAGGLMNIRVEEIRKLERGSLRGLATVNVGGLIRISHIRIIQPEGKEAFIQMPQRSYQTNLGGRRYDNVLDLPDDLTREVEKAILWFWNQERHTSAPEQ